MLYIPTLHDIESLRTGDSAYDAFGRMATIVGEVYKAKDRNGKLFAHYYTQMSENSTCSMGMKEGELVRHVGTSAKFNSWQLDDIERDMLAKGERVREL